MMFLSKHISLYELGKLKWILDIIWPLNQHFHLKNQRNWKKQIWMLNFLNGINCILLHWRKKLTLEIDCQNLQRINGYLTGITTYIKNFHKTEVKMVILMCLTVLNLNLKNNKYPKIWPKIPQILFSCEQKHFTIQEINFEGVLETETCY